MPVWGGIKLPSIYKALQSLEYSRHIRGEQLTEGNNPPRTVYHLNESGDKLLREMVLSYLLRRETPPYDWWLVLSFAWATVSKAELIRAVELRLEILNTDEQKKKLDRCEKMVQDHKLPCMMKHIMSLGRRYHSVERQTLGELLDDIRDGNMDDFFCEEGEEI